MRKRSAASTPSADETKELTNQLEPVKRIEFRSAHEAKEEPLREDLTRIVETIFIEKDIDKEWKRLRAGLEIGIKRNDRPTLKRELDRAEKRTHRAFLLYLTAKREMDRWEKENEVVFSAMWNKANRALQEEKEHGSRNKAITDADVRAKAAVLFPDEWKAQERKRRDVKLTVDGLQNLAEQWKSRCFSIRTMLETAR